MCRCMGTGPCTIITSVNNKLFINGGLDIFDVHGCRDDGDDVFSRDDDVFYDVLDNCDDRDSHYSADNCDDHDNDYMDE